MGKFFAPTALKDRFGELSEIKPFLGIEETPLMLEWSFKAATRLMCELAMEIVPIMELYLSLAEDIYVKTRETSQRNNTKYWSWHATTSNDW